MSAFRIALICALSWLSSGCFAGDEREKEPRPGLPGGKCLAPDGSCEIGECNRARNYCYDTADPCNGFFCGGADRGTCTVDTDLQPRCVCRLGFNNEQWSHYCCPDIGGSDPNCAPVESGGMTTTEPDSSSALPGDSSDGGDDSESGGATTSTGSGGGTGTASDTSA